jgi:hypothetical protein
VGQALRRAEFSLGSVLRRYPRLYLPVARVRRRGEPFTRDTELVIEGFPRSGNTFAVTAFGHAQARPVRVARHEHAAAQVIAAVRAGVPALVLIRDPEEAVLSLLVQHPALGLRQALRAYLRFYRPLLRHRDRFVLATFEEVTGDFGGVIRRVNERFGTGFGVFEHTEENVRACLAAIEDQGRRRWEGTALADLKGSFPSDARSLRKEALRARYRARSLRRLTARARQTYEAMLRPAPDRLPAG